MVHNTHLMLRCRYNSPKTLHRRAAIRKLCNFSASPEVLLRFVIGGASDASVDADALLGDVLTFQVPRNDRRLGTYLLTNRWFQHAVGLGAEYVARADDDAVFDAGSIVHELALVRHTFDAQHIVFGPFSEWFYWDPEAMLESCFVSRL